MERLTEAYYDEFGIKHTKIKENVDKKTYRSHTWTPQEIANDKLAEFEDFMENNKYNSLSDLQADLAILAVTKLTLNLTAKENQTLKNRWNDLYKYVANFYESVASDKRPRCVNEYVLATCEDVLYEMNRLGKEAK